MNPLILSPLQRNLLHHFLLNGPSARQACRAQAVLSVAAGDAVIDVADQLHVSRQTVYTWIQHFQERAGMDLAQRLSDGPRPGRPPSAQGIIDPLIAEAFAQDPRQYGYHSGIWTVPLFQHHLQIQHGVEVSPTSVHRALARLGLRWKRPRYVLAQQPATWRQAKGG